MSGPFTVWLASYPKSGNTWARAVLRNLTGTDLDGQLRQHRSDGEAVDVDINALEGGPIASGLPHVEHLLGFPVSDLTAAEIERIRPLCDQAIDDQLTSIHFRKIHDQLLTREGTPIVAPGATRAAIYLVRDPRDVAVSLAHHQGKSIEWAVAHMAEPTHAFAESPRRIGTQTRQWLGTWSDHVRSWLDQDLFPVMPVRYEDLHADAATTFARLARFAGLEVTDTKIQQAVEAARFDRLQASEAEHGFHERPRKAERFFRRGIVGAWRDELPAALARQIEQDHSEVMARLGYLAVASEVRS